MDELWRIILPLLAAVLLFRSIRKMRQPTMENATALAQRRRYKDAENMLTRLSDAGNLKATTLLGSTYFLDHQPDKAVEVLEKAMAKGDLEANTMLAGVFYDGQHVPRDIERARRYLKPVAEDGNVRMQRQYGLWSIALKDFEEADKWLAMAARYGDKEAQKDRDHLKDIRAGKVPYIESPPALWDEEMRHLVSPADPSKLAENPEQMRAREKLTAEIADAVLQHCGSGKPHYPSVFSCLGSLAGFGCQMAIRDGLIKAGKITERQAFIIVDCADGRKFFIGDLLNRPLIEYPISVSGIIKDGMKKAGDENYPDITELIRLVAQSINGKNYGILNQPKKFQPDQKPMESLKSLWPDLYAKIKTYSEGSSPQIDPKEMGWLFAMAAADLMPRAAEASFSIKAAGAIVMETAISMSKIEPRLIEKK